MAEIIREIKEKRATLIQEGRTLLDAVEKRDGKILPEEQARYDTIFKDAEELRTRIDRLEKQKALDAEAALAEAQRTKDPDPKGADSPEVYAKQRDEYRSLWVRDHQEVLRNARKGHQVQLFSAAERARMETLEMELRTAKTYRAWLKNLAVGSQNLSKDEQRDLMMGSDPAGGFTVPPEQFMAQLLRKVDDFVFIRARATKVVVVKAQDLGVPTLEDNPADADWTSELLTGGDDTAMDVGKRVFAPHALAKQIKISKKLLRASVIDWEAVISDRFAYKFGISNEKGFLTGNGAGQPLGLFTASANGISTARDVSTGNTTTAISADNLRYVKYSLKAPYRRNAAWLFHRDGVKQISLLKDGDGQYLWRAGISEGDPDMLLGSPVMESEYVPNTFTTGLYVGMFADLSYYWIADALDMTVQRLVELYAATNQEGFIMRQETDGMPVFEEAFVRVALA